MNKTSEKLIASQFSSIRNKVSSQDKIDAASELKCHVATVQRYMNGEIAKEPFALSLLGFLKNKIAEREKALT